MIEEKDKMVTEGGDKLVSRKDALLKAGKYAAFTAAAMMTILEPGHAQPPKSPPVPPGAAAKQKKAKKPRTDPPPSF